MRDATRMRQERDGNGGWMRACAFALHGAWLFAAPLAGCGGGEHLLATVDGDDAGSDADAEAEAPGHEGGWGDRGWFDADSLDARPDRPEFSTGTDVVPEIWVPDTWDVSFEYTDAPPEVEPEAGACGDGVVDPGEECDDGDLEDGDECTTQCRFPRCGDGFVWSTLEDCDPPGLTRPCATDCGATGAQTCSAYCQWRSACDPPREVCGNGADDDCDGVTDRIVRETPIVRIADRPTASNPWAGGIAWTGEAFAVVWRLWGGGAVLTQLDPFGARIAWDADLDVGEPMWLSGPFPTGSRFGLFWSDMVTSSKQVVFVPLDTEGWPLAAPTVVGNGLSANKAGVACSDDACLLVWQDRAGGDLPYRYWRCMVAADASSVDCATLPSPCGNDSPQCAVWTGAEYVAATFGMNCLESGVSGMLFVDHFSPDGTLVRSDRAPVTDAGPEAMMFGYAGGCAAVGGRVAVATQSSGLSLLVFDETSPTPREEVVDPDWYWPTHQTSIDLVAGGAELALFWSSERTGNQEVYMARFDAAGNRLGSDIRLTHTPETSKNPVAAWTGDAYGLAWEDSDGTDNSVFFTRFSLCP